MVAEPLRRIGRKLKKLKEELEGESAAAAKTERKELIESRR